MSTRKDIELQHPYIVKSFRSGDMTCFFLLTLLWPQYDDEAEMPSLEAKTGYAKIG